MTPFIHRTAGASSAWSGRAFLALATLATAAFILVAVTPQAEAAFRNSPNGRIAIDLGDAFAPAETFSGFVDKSTGASIAVIDLPADAYDKLKSIPDSEEKLADEGFSGTQKAELKGREGTFFYLVGKQKVPAGDITKFVLIFNQNGATGMIVADVPQAAIDSGKYTREGMEAILATVKMREAPARPADLFRFTHLGPFKEAFDDGGMTKAYNLSGSKPQHGENQLVRQPMLLVSSTVHGDAIDVKAQGREAFKHLGGMKDRRIANEGEIAIANLKGYQIDGEVTDDKTGDTIAIRLVLLSAESIGYFIFLGSVPVADREKMMPEVEKVIASFELVK
jgi:hypothetical protein